MRAGFRDDSADTRLALVQSAPALVIDDLGVERATPWAVETIYAILDDRIIQQRLTVATSNLPPSELEPRIRSRFAEGVVAHIIAPDFRLTKGG
ncbi:MAG: hypothetical protein D6820_00260 [Lentisphaerae bacterium]|nr:MAG: hypothetical protein D6820_00260 [Lentisphaerota bacterium]